MTTKTKRILRRSARQEAALRKASADVNAFIQLCFFDENKKPVRQSEIHRKLQSFLSANSRAVIMFPRDHGKTTQMLARIAWEIGNNPDLRIKIISSSDSIAKSRSVAIQKIIESPIYRAVFPGIKRGSQWTDGAWMVERALISPDATVEAYGIDSAVVGGRADRLYLDDPDDQAVIHSPALRERNVERVDNVWLNLLSPDGRAALLCTPWHEKDIAHTRRTWPILKYAIENMRPIWPERWNVEALQRRKEELGSIAFARGFELLLLSSEEAVIKGHWFKYWESLPRFNAIAMAVDLAIQKDRGDYTAMVALGRDDSGKLYVLDFIRERMDFPETLKRIPAFARAVEWKYGRMPAVGIESVAYQQAMAQALKETTSIPIVELKADKNKIMRAQNLGVHIENGRVLLRGQNGAVHPEQAVIYDEAVIFPGGAHDDLVDALGYAVEMLINFYVSSGRRAVARPAVLPGFDKSPASPRRLPGLDVYGRGGM